MSEVWGGDSGGGGGGMGFRKQMRSLGEFLRKYEFWKLQPDRSFVKGELAKGGGFTSMAESGKQYAVYFKGGGGPSLELELPKGNYSGEWLDAVSGSKKPLAPINHPGGAILLNAPGFPKDFALRLVSDKK